MNIAVVEDMDSDYLCLKKMLAACPAVQALNPRVTRFESGEAFLACFHADKFQLIFLDMLLKGTMNGMDTARAIRRLAPSVPIVFTTTEKDYALDGYEVQAMDYLIKPYSAQRIESVFSRILAAGVVKPHMTIQVGREQMRVCVEELMWAVCGGHAIDLYLTGGRAYHTYMSFEELLKKLPENLDFCCCSRGVVVNLAFVDNLKERDFRLKDGTSVPVSRSKKAEMQTAFREYIIRKTRGGVAL